jgi:hypothetical protein
MSVYINFLDTRHSIDDVLFKKYGIDQRCINLLESIARGQLNSSPLTVSQLMHAGQFGSPATIHRSLSKLRDSNLLVFLHKGTNHRTKYPALTKESKEYFESLSRVLLNLYKSEFTSKK